MVTRKRQTRAGTPTPVRTRGEMPALMALLELAFETRLWSSERLEIIESMLQGPTRGQGTLLLRLPRFGSDDLNEVRRVLAISLKQFVRDEVWNSPPNLVVKGLAVWTDREHQTRLDVDANWPSSFWFVVADILRAEGQRLRCCEVCGNIFARTGRKQYCSTSCGQRLRSRKFYRAHQEDIREQRHETYKKRRRSTQPKAKIKRRRRATSSRKRTP
jgi:hypothetical protein